MRVRARREYVYARFGLSVCVRVRACKRMSVRFWVLALARAACVRREPARASVLLQRI